MRITLKKFLIILIAVASAAVPSTLTAQFIDNSIPCLPAEECCSPDWVDVAYIAPKVCYEHLSIKKSSYSPLVFPGFKHGKSLNGCVFGLNFGYACKGSCGIYVQLDTSYVGGRLQGHQTFDRYVYNLDVEGILGYQIAAYNFTIIPYIGLGYGYHTQNYRHKDRRGDRFKLHYHTLYIPFGIMLNAQISPCWEIGLNAKGNPQADSTLRIHSFSKNRMELGKMTGYLFELPVTWNTICQTYCWKVIFIPYCNYTPYGKSSFEYGFFVPQHAYTDFGLKLVAGTVF